MKSKNAETVYIVGAGFSAGLGYPLTANLLVDVWPRLSKKYQDRLGKIIKFHHQRFDPARNTTFPYIEELLTEINVNLDMFGSSRPIEGVFTKATLEDVQAELLTQIARWFHTLYKQADEIDWLTKVTARIKDERATVISFNWDLVLDQRLFGGTITPANYGLTDSHSGPVLLKPHGSLNWYEGDQIKPINAAKKVKIYKAENTFKPVWAFLPPRGIKSTSGRRYTPLIVPPTYIKDFRRPISGKLWQRCTNALSVAKEIVVLGYSLPEADLQAKFILRCGFHNQTEGTILSKDRRSKPTGAARVTVVNPDSSSARRMEAVVGWAAAFEWKAMKVEDWAATL